MDDRVSVVQMKERLPKYRQVLSFACDLPQDMSFVPSDPDDTQRRALPSPVHTNTDQTMGIVGTISFLGSNSVIVWFSWGNIRTLGKTRLNSTTAAAPDEERIGSEMKLIMGPLCVAMPKTKYKGAFSSETPTSKLISSSDGIQSEIIADHVAERLSQKLKLAVFCSCDLDATPVVPGCDGVLERQMLRSRAGSLVEQKVARIIEKEISTF